MKEDKKKYSREYMRKYRKDNPLKIKDFKLKQKYGITLIQFNEMFEIQDGVCVICKIAKATCVDHCHTTGKVRGILCSNCNTALGMFKDDVKVLLNAINYLDNI